MPYIHQDARFRLRAVEQAVDQFIAQYSISDGELNYLITLLGLKYLEEHIANYTTISDVVKAMECAKLEFYRRIAIDYENQKIKENGDVYPANWC